MDASPPEEDRNLDHGSYGEEDDKVQEWVPPSGVKKSPVITQIMNHMITRLREKKSVSMILSLISAYTKTGLVKETPVAPTMRNTT